MSTNRSVWTDKTLTIALVRVTRHDKFAQRQVVRTTISGACINNDSMGFMCYDSSPKIIRGEAIPLFKVFIPLFLKNTKEYIPRIGEGVRMRTSETCMMQIVQPKSPCINLGFSSRRTRTSDHNWAQTVYFVHADNANVRQMVGVKPRF